jgi:hypothetical protein
MILETFTMQMKLSSKWSLRAVSVAAVIAAGLFGLPAHAQDAQDLQADAAVAVSKAFPPFKMVRSKGIVDAGCLPKASGTVKIRSEGEVEVMDVALRGLPAKTGFDFFVIQTPDFPFGLSWYQGDIETDAYGNGYARFIGRFNIETFIVAPDGAKAPTVHRGAPFPDAAYSPKTAPVHTYHLGLWFNSPKDAAKAGCPDIVTPFNGDHNAGTQVLNTSQFPDQFGPLRRIK